MRRSSLVGSESAASASTFAKSGYIGCSVATFSFAIALYLALRAPEFVTGRNPEIVDAVLTATAASLCAIALAFEAYEWGPTRGSDWGILLLGVCALPVFVWLFSRHDALAWIAIGVVVTRIAVLIWRAISLNTLVALCASTLVGYWAFLLTYVDGYKTPWIHEGVLSGTAHVDMMFHAAIVNMLTGFAAASLGIDGVAPFPYHFASHHLAGLLSHFLGVGALDFYALIFPLLFAPLYLLAMFVFAMAFRAYLARIGVIKTGNGADQEGFGPFWIALLIAFIGLIPAAYRRELGVWDNVFHSESFGVSVLIAYLAGVWLLDQLGRSETLRLRWYAFPAIAIYLIVLCSLKISVGAVVGCLLAYAVLRLPMTWMQRVLAWLAMSCALVYGYIATQLATQGAEAGPGLLQMFKPFAFIRDVLPPDRWVPSFFAFFGPALLLLAIRIWQSFRANHRPSLRNGLKSLGDLEMIVVLTVISVTPGLILSIPQGSTNFFAEVSYWWVQPMLAVVMSSIIFTAVRPTK